MTAETRYLADFEDIIGLRLECRKCGAVISRQPKTAREELPSACGNCGTPWFVGENSDKNMAEAFIRIVKHLATMPDQMWRLRLELRPPTVG